MASIEIDDGMTPEGCFERSFRHLIYTTKEDDWQLVHGSIRSGAANGPRRKHAWLVRGNNVYDVTRDRFYTVASYHRQLGASAAGKYTKSEAMTRWIKTGRYGPWNR